MKARGKRHNVVWIELERHNDDAKNVQAAEAGTKLLNKLGMVSSEFKWLGDRYIISSIPDGSYWDLPDDGHYFNLDYLTKDTA